MTKLDKRFVHWADIVLFEMDLNQLDYIINQAIFLTMDRELADKDEKDLREYIEKL